MPATPSLDTFVRAYIECALWTLTDDAGEPCDYLSVSDIAPETLAKMREDCADFHMLASVREDYMEAILDAPGAAGHDFWLTRNGHGAGFWDGDWPHIGNELTTLCKSFGSFDLYIGDDGKVHGA